MTTLNNWYFKSPAHVVFGHGTVGETGKHLKKLQTTRCLIVTDPGLVKVGLLGRVTAPLQEMGISYVVCDQVQPEPVVENVEAALQTYNEQGCDAFIGFGGGSAIDVAKAAAMLVTNPGTFQDYAGIGKVTRKSAPLVAIPTTAGTGSEVSIFSIMVVGNAKMGVVDHLTIPDVAIVDPMLCVSVPRNARAATGIDALCHHIESFLSTNASPMCDAICLKGIELVSHNIRAAVASSGNLDAHYWMANASMLGGYVMNLTEGAAANHALAFALGGLFHVPHGLSNAVLLPYVFKVIAAAEHPKVLAMGKAMGLCFSGLSDAEGVDKTVAAIHRLVSDVGCLLPLSSFGVKEEDINALVEETMKQTRVMGHSTYQLTAEEVHSIFASAL